MLIQLGSLDILLTAQLQADHIGSESIINIINFGPGNCLLFKEHCKVMKVVFVNESLVVCRSFAYMQDQESYKNEDLKIVIEAQSQFSKVLHKGIGIHTLHSYL